MAHVIRAGDEDSLSRITDEIHDHWFSLDDLQIDLPSGTVEIRFIRPPLKVSGTGPDGSVEAVLRVHRVGDCTIADSEQVGSYDFNELRYDRNRQRLSITTGVPLILELQVDALEVSLEITDRVVGPRRSWWNSIWSRPSSSLTK